MHVSDGKLTRRARSGCDSLVGAGTGLAGESSEDGDGATGRSFSELEKGRMPDPLCFAVQLDFFSEVQNG